MDWVSILGGFLVGLLGQVGSLAMLSRQRRKMDAETAKMNADTASTWRGLYDGMIESLTAEVERLTRERDLERERVRDLRVQVDLLHEQKAAAIGHNLALTAELGRFREVAHDDTKATSGPG